MFPSSSMNFASFPLVSYKEKKSRWKIFFPIYPLTEKSNSQKCQGKLHFDWTYLITQEQIIPNYLNTYILKLVVLSSSNGEIRSDITY